MQPPSSPTPSGPLGSHSTDVLLSLISMLGGGGLIAAWFRWSAARSSKPAELQEAVTNAFSALTGDLQEERAWLTAHISGLERRLADRDLQIKEQAGVIRGLEQSRDSLLTLLSKSDINLPGVPHDDEH